MFAPRLPPPPSQSGGGGLSPFAQRYHAELSSLVSTDRATISFLKVGEREGLLVSTPPLMITLRIA